MQRTLDDILLEANTYADIGQRFRFIGEMLGYPDCCIDFFIANQKPYWFLDLPWFPTRTLKLDGYIPCEKCAKLPRQVLVNDINSRRKIKKLR